MTAVETRYAVPGWGAGELWRSDGVVAWNEFRFGAVSGATDGDDELVARFHAFLAGDADDFADVEIDLGWATPFQRDLAEALRAVPRGDVVSYGELAALAGRPGAARAAGAFCAANRYAFVVPCHRVVVGDGHRRLRLRRRRGEAAAARARGSLALITSEDVREELARIAPQRECDRRAELSALFHSAGSLHLRGAGDWALHLDLGSGAAARRAFALLRDSGIRSEIRTYRRRAFDAATRYQLHVPGDAEALRVLAAAGVVDRRHAPLERPPRRVVARSCCRAAYLRGAFLGAGSLSLARSPHLELRTASPESAALLSRLARAEGVELAVAERATHALAYAKSWESIESLLALMGATETVLALEERSVVAETRSRANRLANADHANLVRTSRSAQAAARGGRAAAGRRRARERSRTRCRRQPSFVCVTRRASLSELAARSDPPASKAALHRRLRSLEELAPRLDSASGGWRKEMVSRRHQRLRPHREELLPRASTRSAPISRSSR